MNPPSYNLISRMGLPPRAQHQHHPQGPYPSCPPLLPPSPLLLSDLHHLNAACGPALCEISIYQVHLVHTAPRVSQGISVIFLTITHSLGGKDGDRRPKQGKRLPKATQWAKGRVWDLNPGQPVPKTIYLHQPFSRQPRNHFLFWNVQT